MSSPLIINGIYCPEPDFDGYNAYESILREHSDVLVALAEYLLVNETMTGEDFAYFCEHKCLPPLPEKSPEVQKAEAALLSDGEAGAEERGETPEEGSEARAEENEEATAGE